MILGKSYDEKMSKDVKLKSDEISIEVMEFLGVQEEADEVKDIVKRQNHLDSVLLHFVPTYTYLSTLVNTQKPLYYPLNYCSNHGQTQEEDCP